MPASRHDRPGLTILLIVRDERESLCELLPSLLGHGADEVIVVDTGSSDGTEEEARRLGARVFERPWDDDFSAARNRGLEEVRTSHVMWLDADDRISPADLAGVRREALRRGNAGLLLTLVNVSDDTRLASSCRQLRVFPSRAEHRFTGRVHEQVQPSLAATGTPLVPFEATIRHLGYAGREQLELKSRRNLALCRLDRDEGRSGIAFAYHHVKAAALCGERDEAAAIARATVDAPPEDAPQDILQNLRVTLGKVEWERGRRDEAERRYRDAVDAVPADPFALLHLGELLRLTGRPREAVSQLERARAAPLHGTRVPVPETALRQAILVELGRAYEALGDLGAVERVLGAVPAESAGEVPVVLLRASLAFGRRRNDESARLYEALARAVPGEPFLELRRGLLALRAGRREEGRARLAGALDAFDTQLRRDGPDPALLTRLGECYQGLGEPAAARLAYQEALRLVPGLPEAEQALSGLEEAGVPR